MAPLRILDDLGTQLLFYGRSFAWAPRTVSRYKREVVRLLAEVSFGSGALAVVPLYVVGLLSSYLATRTIATGYFGQSTGTYDYYFHLFLPPVDVLWSFVKVLVFSLVVVLVHCYYGYTATGGPAGVGVAVGRAVRLAIVAVNVVDFFLSLAIWGATTTVRIAG